MCGIFCYVSNGNDIEKQWEQQERCWRACEPYVKRRGPDALAICSQSRSMVTMAASVLWLQGAAIIQQPLEDDRSILAYNGDIYRTTNDSTCDTIVFKQLLDRCSHNDNSSDSVNAKLRRVRGPYAFIYHRKGTDVVLFGRDIYGRKSLLIGGQTENGGGAVFLSSVCPATIDCIAVPAAGTYAYNTRDRRLTLYKWSRGNDGAVATQLDALRQRFDGRFTVIEPPEVVSDVISPKALSMPADAITQLIDRLRSCTFDEAMDALSSDVAYRLTSQRVERLLTEAVRRRVFNQPHGTSRGTTTILFSGGIDCTLMALLAARCLPRDVTIELVNVAFASAGNDYAVPDRRTALLSFEELEAIVPDRQWKFVAVDVGRDDLDERRRSRIRHVVHPLKTVLDDSLGCVLWYAASGASDTTRVVLIGTGADELFGGYNKHRVALKRDGWLALEYLMRRDQDDISVRNLGRDDRTVADHGKQLRLPYLDEELVEFVKGLHGWQKTLPIDGLQFNGEKLLLRHVAYCLGLKQAAQFKKRAMQFGTRIADKRENANDVSPRLID